jgi:CRP-like cAMP-binding protein
LGASDRGFASFAQSEGKDMSRLNSEMRTLSSSLLAPVIAKLARRLPLGRDDIDAFVALPHQVVGLSSGSYLVREGSRTERCCALLSGFAYRHKMTGEGVRQILAIHLQGDVLDLHNSLLDRADHSVQALTPIEVVFIPQRAIDEVVERQPALGRALWKDSLVDGSLCREWILNVGRRGAKQRIAHLFCELALRQEAAGLCCGPRYEWPMTQEQVGDATGLTSVHVNRTLQSMRSDGLIATNKATVTILDWKGLQSAGDFNSAYLHEAA